MRNLIIPDVHLEFNKLDRIFKMEAEQADRIIFLGDLFDSYHDNVWQNMSMAHRLNDLSKDPKIEFLYGNHDLHYLYRNDFVRCSGFSTEKFRAVHPNLQSKTIESFNWFTTINNGKILLTHAGLHPNFWKLKGVKPQSASDVVDFVSEEAIEATRCLQQNKDHWFYRAGYARGGRQKFGGIVWLDASRFTPNAHVGQMFGHTFQGEHPKWFDDQNICMDTNLNHYAIFDEGLENPHFEVHSVWFGAE